MELHQSKCPQVWRFCRGRLGTGARLLRLTGGGLELILSVAVPPKTNGSGNAQQNSIQDRQRNGFPIVPGTNQLTLKDERERRTFCEL